MSVITVLSSAICHGAMDEERTWTGVNGRNLRGSFHRLTPDGKQVEIATPEGKLVSIALQNLSEADRKFILHKGMSPPPDAEKQPTGDPNAFKPTAFPDRGRIGFVPPDEDGGTFTNHVAHHLWISTLWWDAEGLIALPSKGDPKLGRKLFGRKLMRMEAADKVSLETELHELYAGKAVFRSYSEMRDLSPKRLSELTSGPNLVSMWLNARDSYLWVDAFIASVSEDGDFVIFIDGCRLVGTMKVLDTVGPDKVADSVAFNISNPGDLPKSMVGKPLELLANRSNLRCTVIKPYLLAVEGAASPPPPDPGFPVCVKPESPKVPVTE